MTGPDDARACLPDRGVDADREEPDPGRDVPAPLQVVSLNPIDVWIERGFQ